MYECIEFASGDRLWVTLPMSRHAIASTIYQEFKRHLVGVYPWMWELDGTLFPRLTPYYNQIAACMLPAFAPIDLDERSRHRFFVGGDRDEANPSAPSPLSQLERLLGLSYPDPTAKPAPPPLITSGDPVIDLQANLLLMFKSDTQWLMDRHPIAHLSKLVVQAADQQDPNLRKTRQQERDRAALDNENTKAAIRAHYERKGIPLPDDFDT